MFELITTRMPQHPNESIRFGIKVTRRRRNWSACGVIEEQFPKENTCFRLIKLRDVSLIKESERMAPGR